ncbi:hypothetical protein AFK66_022285 [Cronobacter malonaticus LMG 23826]|nr:hypothetical protein AFK66_022285 [Cronobacter malonaticus LMG 23826]
MRHAALFFAKCDGIDGLIRQRQGGHALQHQGIFVAQPLRHHFAAFRHRLIAHHAFAGGGQRL